MALRPLLLAGMVCSSLLLGTMSAPAAATTSGAFPDAQASDPARLGWMVGAPLRQIGRFVLKTGVIFVFRNGAGALRISAS